MPETVVLKQALWKSSLAIVGSAVFVVGGVFMLKNGGAGSSRYSPEFVMLIGWACILFFGAAGLFGIAGLFKRTQVTLTPEGFRVTGLRTKPLVAWSGVQEFYIIKVRQTKIVSYDFKPELKAAMQYVAAMRPSGWGADGAIPTLLEGGPDRALAVLEDWRRRYN